MEVHFSSEIETRLHQVASAHGKDAEQLVKDTVGRMLESQARFVAGVNRGLEQADRGELVEHGPVEQVLREPKHPYTKALIACVPRLGAKSKRLPTVEEMMAL